jgi:ketosteroid isomerase-like protein
MPEDEIGLIRDGYDAINRGDFEAVSELFDPDAEVVSSGVFLDPGAVYQGVIAAQAFIANLRDAFDELEYVVKDIREGSDGRYLVSVRLRGRGRTSGIEADTPMHHVITVRGGRVARILAIADETEARRAAGLSD